MQTRLAASALLIAAAPALAQDLGPPDPTRAIGPGPWDNDLVLLRSQDGKSFPAFGVLASRAASATLCAGEPGGRLVAAFLWYPEQRPEAFDQIAVAFSADQGGTWSEPLPIVILGLPDELARPGDPCLVALPDGRFRLYFISQPQDGPAAGPFPPGGWPAAYSAVSDDALLWTFEDGARFALEGSRVGAPSVARFQGQ
jgi:hypothetical protein